MGKIKLSNVEFESILMYFFVGLSMVLRGGFLVTITQENINDSDFYTVMDFLIPIQVWGAVMLMGAFLVWGCILSLSVKKYYLLMVGSLLGLIAGGGMAILGFIYGLNLFTPLQTGSVAFFNMVLLIHGGVVLLREKRKTPM